MLEKIKKLSKSPNRRFYLTLPIFGLLLITNPSIDSYKFHEAKRFNQGYQEQTCNSQYYRDNYNGTVTEEVYQNICRSVILEFTNNPERLLSFIALNTQRKNYFAFSTYYTEYYNIDNQISEKVKQHPSFISKNTSNSVGHGSGGQIPANGIFGNFYDPRKSI